MCKWKKGKFLVSLLFFLCGFVSGVDFGFYETIVIVIAKNTGH